MTRSATRSGESSAKRSALSANGDMWMRDPDGGPCTYANFFVSTLFGLSAFKVAYHITGEQRFQDKYLELIDPHFFLGHAMKDCWRQQDAFFQHYQQDSPIYHLLMYETDPRLKRAYARCLRGLHNESLANGNVYHLIGHAAFQPEAAKGPAASRELTQFSETQLSMPVWHGRVEKALSADDADLPDSVRRTLEALLSGDRTSLDPDELYIPIEWRPPMEFGWQYDRHALSPGHGPHTRYSGVDYLIAFWMGRYHGVV